MTRLSLGSIKTAGLQRLGLWVILTFILTLAACSPQPPRPPEDKPDVPPPYLNHAGWTVFTPAPDSRLVYVSSSRGNDDTGQVHSPSDSAIGADPRRPAGHIKPFKTFSAAFAKTREGHPDWVLLRRGDTFHGSLAVRSGRSKAEPFLLAAYGQEPARPLVKVGPARGIEICCESFNDIAIQGLELYGHTRDFDSPEFESTEGTLGISAYVKEGHVGRGLLIEACKLHFFSGNAIQADGRLTEVVFRRNLVLDNYSTHGHAQGLFARDVSIRVEENIFDHNGWYKQQEEDSQHNKKGGQATMYNHNTYMQDIRNGVFRNNILLRPSSIGSKWTANDGKASARNILVENNLYVDGEIGISMGGNESGPYRFSQIAIRDNVLLDIGQSQPTGRDFAWYMQIKDWDTGSITGNLFVHPGSDSTDNLYAMRFDGDNRTIQIRDNRIYGFGNGHALGIERDATLENVNIFDNTFVLHTSARNFVRAKGPLSGAAFRENNYGGIAANGPAFSVSGRRLSPDQWMTKINDRNSHIEEGPAMEVADSANYSNILASYQLWLDQQQPPADTSKPPFERLIQALRQQSRFNWDRNYTAESINQWVRAYLVDTGRDDQQDLGTAAR